jgi:hypothetical protein
MRRSRDHRDTKHELELRTSSNEKEEEEEEERLDGTRVETRLRNAVRSCFE